MAPLADLIVYKRIKTSYICSVHYSLGNFTQNTKRLIELSSDKSASYTKYFWCKQNVSINLMVFTIVFTDYTRLTI